jgi:hypothetical protein
MVRHNIASRPELEDRDDLEHRRREVGLREVPRGLEDIVPPVREDYDAERIHEDRDERGRMM